MMDSLTCGGAEKSLVSLLPLLDYGKIDVTLMLVERGGVFECYVPKQVKVVTLPKPTSLRMKWARIGCSLQLRINKIFGKKEHGAETIWKYTGNAFPALKDSYDYAFAYQQGFPTYYIANKVHAIKKYSWVNVDMMKAGYNVDFNAVFYEKYTNIIGVSDAVHINLVNQGYVSDASKVLTIYDILNPQLIRKMSQESGFDDNFKGIRLVTVGRMTPQKSYDLAVLAAEELRERGYKFRWSFVGNGVSRSLIEKLIAERNLEGYIELLGEKANPYPYMAACDIYVQTSSFEGFGLTVTEARILGKAEICTNFPSAYNQITDGETGLICDMNPKAVADKIELLITNADLKAKLESNVAKEVNNTAETESAKVRALMEV